MELVAKRWWPGAEIQWKGREYGYRQRAELLIKGVAISLEVELKLKGRGQELEKALKGHDLKGSGYEQGRSSLEGLGPGSLIRLKGRGLDLDTGLGSVVMRVAFSGRGGVEGTVLLARCRIF